MKSEVKLVKQDKFYKETQHRISQKQNCNVIKHSYNQLWNTKARYGIQFVIINVRNKLNQYKQSCTMDHKYWNYDVSSGKIAKELQLESLSERQESARLNKAFEQYLLGTEFSTKMYHTRRNTIHEHTFQTNIWSSKLLQQIFCSIRVKTMELIPARTQSAVTTSLIH